jgi:anti-anti-sigma factor
MTHTARYIAKLRFDAINSAVHEEAMLALLAPPVHSLVVDLTAVDFLSSAGLRSLLIAAKAAGRAGGDLTVSGMQPSVRDVLVMSGIDQIITLAN